MRRGEGHGKVKDLLNCGSGDLNSSSGTATNQLCCLGQMHHSLILKRERGGRGKERKERSGGEGREDKKIKRSWKTLSFLINRASLKIQQDNNHERICQV